jgi:hypothetical protein
MTGDWTTYLFISMLKEEWRLQKAFVGDFGSAFFPLLIFLMSLVLVLVLPQDDLTGDNALLFFHLFTAFYGMLVGGIALISDMIMKRRMGQVNMLIQLSDHHPMDTRKVLGIFYVKEVFFYILYSIIPLTLGIVSGSLILGYYIPGALMISITLFLSFFLGMSLSFFISSLQVRSSPLALAGIGFLLVPAVFVWPLELIPVEMVFHPYGFWKELSLICILLSFFEAILLSSCAVVFSKRRTSSPSRTYDPEFVKLSVSFSRISGASHLLSKEWIELKRSGTLGPVITGFAGPLLAVYGMVYLFRTGLSADLEFNSVFYGSMVGFFGVMTYSWLTNVEQNGSLNIMPVSVPSVIEIKVLLYFLITSVLTTFYMLLVSVLNGDLQFFPLALGVALANNTYTVSVTAWLTGLRANTMLLDGITLVKFTTMIVPPLITLVIITFYIGSGGYGGLVAVFILSVLLVVISVFLIKGIRRRWKENHFTL